MASASSPPRNDHNQPRQTVTRTARAARTVLLFAAAAILGWTGVGARQFAATYGSWYEHTILVGSVGTLLSVAALMAAHRVAPWHRPTRAAGIVLCLLAVTAVTATGTLSGDRVHEQATTRATSG